MRNIPYISASAIIALATFATGCITVKMSDDTVSADTGDDGLTEVEHSTGNNTTGSDTGDTPTDSAVDTDDTTTDTDTVVEEVEAKWFLDFDVDGYGGDIYAMSVAAPNSSYTLVGGDCNDDDATVHPGVTEVSGNDVDENCDGTWTNSSGTVTYTFWFDDDGDNYGAADVPLTSTSSSAPAGYVSNSTDCNDGDAAIHPGASDATDDNVDNDCDGSIDENYVEPSSTACTSTESLVSATFTAPVGSTISSISGEADDYTTSYANEFDWDVIVTGAPVGMTVTMSDSDSTDSSTAKNRVSISYSSCLNDAVDWNLSVEYVQVDGYTYWDCEGGSWTGTWSVMKDSTSVTPWVDGTEGCDTMF